MIDQEKVTLKADGLSYSGNDGSFATSSKTKKGFTCGAIETCRELFAYNFRTSTNYVIFNKSNINIEKINNFFEQIEDKLKVSEKSVFYYVDNVKTAVLIKVSPFWKENALRKGIFTLFLRCAACYYDGEDIYKSLLKYSLAKQIIGPIEWFMKGNTKPAVRFSGGNTVYRLSGLSRKDWESTLIR